MREREKERKRLKPKVQSFRALFTLASTWSIQQCKERDEKEHEVPKLAARRLVFSWPCDDETGFTILASLLHARCSTKWYLTQLFVASILYFRSAKRSSSGLLDSDRSDRAKLILSNKVKALPHFSIAVSESKSAKSIRDRPDHLTLSVERSRHDRGGHNTITENSRIKGCSIDRKGLNDGYRLLHSYSW